MDIIRNPGKYFCQCDKHLISCSQNNADKLTCEDEALNIKATINTSSYQNLYYILFLLLLLPIINIVCINFVSQSN